MTRLSDYADRAATDIEPRGLPLAIGRTLLAAAEILVLLCSSDSSLFPGLAGPAASVRCDGVAGLSLWCVVGHTASTLVVCRLLALVVLGVTASGFRPRWTCVPHWYVMFSISVSVVTANGGEAAAQVVTLLLVPMCLGDRRTWQWLRPTAALSPGWQGSARAAGLAVRIQVFVIYAVAAGSKLLDPAWRDGMALSLASNDPVFGLPQAIHQSIGSVLGASLPMAVLAWGGIALELTIGVAMFLGRRARAVALMLGTGLHVAIAVVLGIPSFSAVMIALLLIAYAGPRAARTQGVTW
ncbi:MAG TPA: HTTM domain-containing protein [Pseudonocardiaceae bacterium]|nr:HTTM domain-containing protein [Pseudonocardiaceae bacterium]